MTGDFKIKKAAGKVPLDMIPIAALYGVARVFQHGAVKYEHGNFLLAQDDEAPRRYAGALLRHVGAAQGLNGLFSWETLATLDDESGLPDLDHAIACLLMVRAAAIKHGTMPQDPGLSKLVQARMERCPLGCPGDPSIGCDHCFPRDSTTAILALGPSAEDDRQALAQPLESPVTDARSDSLLRIFGVPKPSEPRSLPPQLPGFRPLCRECARQYVPAKGDTCCGCLDWFGRAGVNARPGAPSTQ